MAETSVLHTVLAVLTLLFAATLVAFSLRKSKLPFTVVLVLVGLGLGYLSKNFPPLGFLADFHLSPELIFYIFLPTLIFESAFHINLKHFTQTLVTTSSLATVGLIVSTGLISLGMVYLLDFPWSAALLFGALISATDPVSVLALFKQIGAPKRLAVIVEGESLFNDGTALVLFGIFLDGFRGLASTVESFFLVASGGVIIGGILGFVFSKALDYVKNSKEIEISITLILAHATFIIADYFFGVSGILATVTAGIVIGNYGAYKISPGVKEIMTHFWDYSAFLANSIIFLLVGIIIFNNIAAVGPLLKPLAIVIFLVLFARAFMVYTLVPMVNLLHPQEKTPWSWMHVIQWSGLRGALGIALILTLPADFPLHNELLIFTVGVIFFTIIVNGLTIRPLLSLCGLHSLNTIDAFKLDENRVLIGQRVNEKLCDMLEKGFINKEIHCLVQKDYRDFCRQGANHIRGLFRDCKNELNHQQLAEILKQHLLEVEEEVLTKLYYQGEITQDLLLLLLHNIDSQKSQKEGRKVGIGKLTVIAPDGLWAKVLPRFGFADWVDSFRKKEITLRYEMYRARLISTDAALQTIKEIRKTNAFLDRTVMKEFEIRYKNWHSKAKEKLKALKITHPEIIKKVEIYLARQAAFHLERKMLAKIRSQETLSGNIISEFQEDLEKRENKANRELFL